MPNVTRSLDLPIKLAWDGTPAPAEDHALVTLRAHDAGLSVGIDAPFHGDPPPSHPPGRPCWGLWEHEVVELFVLGPGDRYLEIELGPHGHQLILSLEGRRHIVAAALALPFEPRVRGGRWRATLELPAVLLPPAPHRLNAYAIHGVGPERRYLAHAPVPGPAPDFHRLDCFVPAQRIMH